MAILDRVDQARLGLDQADADSAAPGREPLAGDRRRETTTISAGGSGQDRETLWTAR
jgi:hypothetical protein